MYDNEEEISKKRRRLVISIIVVIILIIILLLFLFVRGKTKKPVTSKVPTCELEVKEGKLGANDTYITEVVVGFKSVTPISESVPIKKSTVGTSDNSRNKDTYTITKKGNVTVNGYVRDANGNIGTCSIKVNVNPSQPTCELEVKEGTLGNDDWYRSDIVVGFKSMETNSETSKIEKYYIEKKTSESGNGSSAKGEVPSESIKTYTVKDNLTTQLYGYVIDSNGNEGQCSITVKKDTDLPTCSLKVIEGTANSSGIYTSNVTVGLASATDSTSDIAEKGVGLAKNYTQETVVVNTAGTTVVYGFVKDGAGNEGTCSITIKRPEPQPAQSNPSCKLEISGTKEGDSYKAGATVKFSSKSTTNGAKITSYGIGTSQSLNGKDSYTINNDGTHTIYGKVRDSYGHEASCSITVKVKSVTYLVDKVSVGDKVAYDAGTWNEKAEIPTTNGSFGGYEQGTSKNSSVVCRTGLDKSTASGWLVLSKEDGKVTIIHAGIPECYYFALNSLASEAVNNINNRAAVYKNSFAESARMMNYSKDHKANVTAINNIGSHYYMAEAKDKSTLYYQTYTNRLAGGSGWASGIRPVIVLKSNVTTTGKDSSGAWTLSLSGGRENSNLDIDGISISEIVEIIKNNLNI